MGMPDQERNMLGAIKANVGRRPGDRPLMPALPPGAVLEWMSCAMCGAITHRPATNGCGNCGALLWEPALEERDRMEG
jgi:hypothetical protein